ncbi:unnamed protein product [Ixodes persulcatus]
MGPAGSCCYLAFIRPLLVGNWTSEVINDGVNYTDNYGALKCRRWCFRCPSCCFFGGNLSFSFVFCLWEDDDCHFGREGESRRRSLARLSALEPGYRSSGLFTMLDP